MLSSCSGLDWRGAPWGCNAHHDVKASKRQVRNQIILPCEQGPRRSCLGFVDEPNCVVFVGICRFITTTLGAKGSVMVFCSMDDSTQAAESELTEVVLQDYLDASFDQVRNLLFQT